MVTGLTNCGIRLPAMSTARPFRQPLWLGLILLTTLSAMAHQHPFGYNDVMNTFHRSDVFDSWLAELKDKLGRARIAHRVRSAEHGNFADCEPP